MTTLYSEGTPEPPTQPKSGSAPPPKLAPPGAGIPWPAMLFLRFWVNPFVAGREDPAKSRARFARVHEKVRAAFLEIPESRRTEKVLVPRQPGLEDSSRFWSAAMVLEHLDIVGRGIAEGIISLSHGRVPDTKVSTAAVKPIGSRSAAEALAVFDRLLAELPSSLATRVKDLDSPATLEHPWFGAFTARKWHWLLGIHGEIHLRQIRAIRDGLKAQAPRCVRPSSG